MTRAYRLGKRAESQAETRARIVSAALDLYAERGMSATSMLAVARAADVAPGTVRHHFADPTALAVAAGEAVLDRLALPDAAPFAGMRSTRARMERLARELAAFSDRGEVWWFVMQRDAELATAWSTLTDWYDARLRTLIQAALGPLAEDERSEAVVAAVIGPPTFYALKGRGFTSAEAAAIGVELAVPWLERRERELRRPAR
jgi:AcrR family transcriptional regulator